MGLDAFKVTFKKAVLSWHSGCHPPHDDAYAVQTLHDDAYAVQALHNDTDAVQAHLLQLKALGNLHPAERFANGLILGCNGSEACAQLLDLLRLQTQPLHQLLTDLACCFLHQ